MEKEKIIIKTSLIILFSFFLLIATTYFINENLVFSQQNKYEDPIIVIKYQEENFSELDIFGIKKSILLKKTVLSGL